MPFVAHPFCNRGPQDAPLEREHSRGKKVAWIGVVGKGGDFVQPVAVQLRTSSLVKLSAGDTMLVVSANTGIQPAGLGSEGKGSEGNWNGNR
jgi:hypothetical protein